MRDSGGGSAPDRLGRQVRFRGRLLRLEVDRVREPLPGGGFGPLSRREVVRHPGAVAVVARTAADEIVLVRQYRYAAGRTLLEIPAGTREPGEEPDATAVRELAEETGYRAASWRPLGSFFTAPGFCDEVIHLFLAEGLTPGAANPDPGEFVEPVPVSSSECRRLLAGEDGEDGRRIEDAKTLAALGRFFLSEPASEPGSR